MQALFSNYVQIRKLTPEPLVAGMGLFFHILHYAVYENTSHGGFGNRLCEAVLL